MMNQIERITAMDSLNDYLDRMVTVDFIYYAAERWQRTGSFLEFEPFSYVVIDPYQYLQSVGLVKGENRFLEERDEQRPIRIDFVSGESAIISIKELVGIDSNTIYSNQWIIPDFNPSYHNTRGEMLERGAIVVKENADDIVEHVRKVSFGQL